MAKTTEPAQPTGPAPVEQVISIGGPPPKSPTGDADNGK